jgi:Fe-S-cluster containining protein
MQMDVEIIAEEARKSIGKYCMEECSSLCCRKGNIDVTDKEMFLITGHHGSVACIKTNGKYLLCLENDCPRLKDHKCMIHSQKGRPDICKEFPVFVRGNNIIFSHDCPAVQSNKMYPFEHRFIKEGFHIK